jgi:beta-glucuronidase
MRRFREHEKRRVHDLSGVFDFALLGDDVDPDAVDVGSLRFDDRITVPGCFDSLPRYAGYRGLAAYRKRLPRTGRERGRLVVGAAHHFSRSFVNGECIGEHSGGFTRFSHDFRMAPGPDTDLVILVDNRFDRVRSPLHHPRYDWYQYGGITRGLELHELGGVAVDHLEVTTESVEPPRVRVRVVYTAFATADLPLEVSVQDRMVHASRVDVTPGNGSLELELALSELEPWSPGHPRLYSLRVQLGDDDLVARFGLRTVEARGRALWLNGERLRLAGVNRHEAHPTFGHAVPLHVQLHDLRLLRELGANTVRGCHYPQDPLFLDLCDEAGLLVYQEAIGWQQTEEELRDEAFVRALEQHVDEMLAMSMCHPSIIAWGFLNEGSSDRPTSRVAYERIARRLRGRDPSRPVTFASNRHGTDLYLDLVDFVSINLYPAWYSGTMETAREEFERIVAMYRARAPALPIVVSEVGAGALHGRRGSPRERWTEEYQAELLDRVLSVALEPDSDLSGVLLWQFCDCRTNERVKPATERPRGFNNKGLLDEYRRPKLAWRVVMDRLRRHR